VSAPSTQEPALRSLTWSTEFDALPLDAVYERREDCLAVRSPSNPGHYYGNLLVFDDAPGPGDRERWEHRFDDEFGGDPRVRHKTFVWDRIDGEIGHAHEEFAAHGYDLEHIVGLTADLADVRPHPRENRSVSVRMLDPLEGADEDLWAQMIAVQLGERDERIEEQALREHRRKRQGELRLLFRERGGGWYVALDASGQQVLAGCGLVVHGGRVSIQAVDTAAAHRRKGICSRLLVEALHDLARRQPVGRVLIGADSEYHALGLYESLGFRRAERVTSLCRLPAHDATG